MGWAFILGAVLGFVGSIPVAGPIAALVLARSMQGRIRAARRIAFGAAIAESLYAFLAFLGFAQWLSKYAWLAPVSKGVAAVIMFVLAGLVFSRRKKKAVFKDFASPSTGASFAEHTPTPTPTPAPTREPVFRNLLLGFSITIVNPTLLATWTAVVTAVYSLELVDFNVSTGITFAIGCVVGITGWAFSFTALAHSVRARLKPSLIRKLVIPFSAFLALIGLWLAIQAARDAFRVFA